MLVQNNRNGGPVLPGELVDQRGLELAIIGVITGALF